MTRENFVLSILLFTCALPPLAGAAEHKLVWTYPCDFSYSDNSAPYENKISSPECDYLHATFGKTSVEDFATYTSTAQYAFLSDVAETSSDTYKEYQEVIKQVLAQTDPKNPKTLPPGLSPKDRLQKLMALQSALVTYAIAAFKPFQWEQPVEDSYLDQKGGGLPKSWNPYIDPVRPRAGELSKLIQPLQGQMADAAGAKVSGTIAKMEALKKKSPTAEELVAKLWGAAYENPGSLVGPGVAGQPMDSKDLTPLPGTTPPVSPQLAPPAPLPAPAPGQNKYDNFSRGYAQGMQRVSDEASIAWWHYTGQTQTVGNPVGKSNLVFQQEGGSCALGSQFQALESRGLITPTKDDSAMRAFVSTAQANGYFIEIRDKKNQPYGGTSSADLDKMLTYYKVPHSIKDVDTDDAAQLQNGLRDLDRAVLRSGDAIVTVEAGKFWNDPKTNGGHAVYLTGAEVDKTGRVVGYYFNDTGTGEGARFVSAADFAKAWTGGLITFPPSPAAGNPAPQPQPAHDK
jgi:hypothetical protein